MRLRSKINKCTEESPLSDDAARAAFSGMYFGRRRYLGALMLSPDPTNTPKTLRIEREAGSSRCRDYYYDARQDHLGTQADLKRVCDELNSTEGRAQIRRTEIISRVIKESLAAFTIAAVGLSAVLVGGSEQVDAPSSCTDEIAATHGPGDVYDCEVQNRVDAG